MSALIFAVHKSTAIKDVNPRAKGLLKTSYNFPKEVHVQYRSTKPLHFLRKKTHFCILKKINRSLRSLKGFSSVFDQCSFLINRRPRFFLGPISTSYFSPLFEAKRPQSHLFNIQAPTDLFRKTDERVICSH